MALQSGLTRRGSKATLLLLICTLSYIAIDSLECARHKHQKKIQAADDAVVDQQFEALRDQGHALHERVIGEPYENCGKRGYFYRYSVAERENYSNTTGFTWIEQEYQRRRGRKPNKSAIAHHGRALKRVRRIANGTFVRDAEFPSFVMIGNFIDSQTEATSWCGGVLVGPRTVLTAASCFEDDRIKDIHSLEVFAGIQLEWSDIVENRDKLTRGKVDQIRNDPRLCRVESDHRLLKYDLAVVFLNDPLRTSDKVYPTCTAWGREKKKWRRDDDIYHVPGMGLKTMSAPGRYQKTRLSTLWCPGNAEEIRKLSGDTVRCYGTWNTDMCKYDKGDPVYYYRTDERGDTLQYVAGIVSSPSTDSCSPGKNAIYVTDLVSMQDAMHRIFAQQKSATNLIKTGGKIPFCS